MSVLTVFPVWLVIALVALLPALEASTFVGLAVPGETAVVAGGVVAHGGAVPLWLVIASAAVGAVVGDQVGFRLGRRYGARLLGRLPARVQSSASLQRAIGLVRRRGATAVFIGRWAAALRALVPGVAGLSGVAPLRFSVANVAGGTLWAGAVATAGYLAGASYGVLVHRLGIAGDAVLATVALSLAIGLLRHRTASRRTLTRTGPGARGTHDDA